MSKNTTKTISLLQTKQKLGKTQLKKQFVWALVDKKDGYVYDTFQSREDARTFKNEFTTVKKVQLIVIGRG